MNYQRINIVLLCLLAVLLMIGTTNSSAQTAKNEIQLMVKPTRAPSPTSTPTPTPTPPYPVRFVIPKLNIDAAVEPVGNDESGTMLLPQETDKVGWYYQGYKPGEKGNAVIGGHLDLVTGAPAIFYNLKMLAIGDTIKVVDAFGVERTFKVVRVEQYIYDEIPIESIFGKSDAAHLNLITCAGIFDQAMHNYSHRLVIFTEKTD